MTDVMVIDSQYYLLQQDWLWRVTLAQPSASEYMKQINNNQAKFINNSDNLVVSAFYDRNYDLSNKNYRGLVVFKDTDDCYYASPMYQTKQSTETYETRVDRKNYFTNNVEIHATASSHAGNEFLAAVRRRGQNSSQMFLAKFSKSSSKDDFTFDFDQASFQAISFKSISAMFMPKLKDPQARHLYIVSEYFLYIFQSADKLNESSCVVTPVASFFQCDPALYKANGEYYPRYEKYLVRAYDQFNGAKELLLGRCVLVARPFANDRPPEYNSVPLPDQVVFANKSTLDIDSLRKEPSRNMWKAALHMFLVILALLAIVMVMAMVIILGYRYCSYKGFFAAFSRSTFPRLAGRNSFSRAIIESAQTTATGTRTETSTKTLPSSSIHKYVKKLPGPKDTSSTIREN